LRQQSASGQLRLDRLKAENHQVSQRLGTQQRRRNEATRQEQREKITAAGLLADNVHAIGQNILTNTRMLRDYRRACSSTA
jgi:hypothetical protein